MFADQALYDRFYRITKTLARDVAATATEVEGLRNTFLDLGDSYAVYAGKDSFLTQAKGIFTKEHLEALDAFYREHGCKWEAILSPFAGIDALQRTLEAGGKPEQWECLLYRPLTAPTCDIELGEGIEVTVIKPEAGDEWTATMGHGFFGEETNPMLEKLGRIYQHTPNTTRYLARVSGVPAGGASLILVDETAYFAGAAVIPEFRGRGLQNALISRRLQDASGIASLAFVGTSPGTSSQRNAERHGFRLAFNLLSVRMPI